MINEQPLIPFQKTISTRLIDKLIDRSLEITRSHYNTLPVGAEFNTFVNDLRSIFPPTVQNDAFFASVMYLAGQEITREVVRQTTWRLAGNLDKLKAGVPVPLWQKQSELEWVEIKIVRGQINKNRRGKIGFWYDYRVLTGSPAGLRFKAFYTLRYIKFISRALGFTRPSKNKYTFRDGTELVGMRFHILLDPELSTNEGPGHYFFKVTSTVKTANVRILKQRIRVIPCPEDYKLSELQCFRCIYGYDKCAAGCHPFTYIQKPCPRCSDPTAWFDPASSSTACADCEDYERLNKE